jgi:hypothetical protein
MCRLARSKLKVVDKDSVVVVEIIALKYNPSTLLGKSLLRTPQELARPHFSQAPGYKIINSLKRLSLEKGLASPPHLQLHPYSFTYHPF